MRFFEIVNIYPQYFVHPVYLNVQKCICRSRSVEMLVVVVEMVAVANSDLALS